MTIGERVFYHLKEKKMTQKAFSDMTGIATTTISDWKKKNTNPSSDKILPICKALDLTPEELLSGVSEEGARGRETAFQVIPKGTEEYVLLEEFGNLSFEDRAQLLTYAKKLMEKGKN